MAHFFFRYFVPTNNCFEAQIQLLFWAFSFDFRTSLFTFFVFLYACLLWSWIHPTHSHLDFISNRKLTLFCEKKTCMLCRATKLANTMRSKRQRIFTFFNCGHSNSLFFHLLWHFVSPWFQNEFSWIQMHQIFNIFCQRWSIWVKDGRSESKTVKMNQRRSKWSKDGQNEKFQFKIVEMMFSFLQLIDAIKTRQKGNFWRRIRKKQCITIYLVLFFTFEK